MQFTRKAFSTPHGVLSYIDEGTGPAVVFCHGTPSSAAEFSDCYLAMKKLGVQARWLALDHLGFGQSQKPPHAPYTLDTHAAAFSSWMNSLGLESVHLVLHDFGGPIGLPWAIANVPKVKSLTLLNTWFWPFERVDSGFESQKKILGSRWMKFLYLSLNISPRFLVKMAWGKHQKITPEQHAAFTAPFPSKQDRYALYGMVQALLDSRSFWSSHPEAQLQALVSVPTQILWGMVDPLIKPIHLARWRELFPRARVQELPKVGHFPLLEDPATTARWVSTLMQEK